MEIKTTKWLRGGHTFPYMTVGRRRRKARSYQTKEEASDRIAKLLVKGEFGDRLASPTPIMTKKEKKFYGAKVELALLPLTTRAQKLRIRRWKLEDQLRQIEENGSRISKEFHRPGILRQLEEISKEIGELECSSNG
jgi:hypothetical protein